MGLYGSAYREHDQRSIVCTLAAAAILLASYIVAASLQRFLRLPNRAVRGDWLAEAAHDLASRPWSIRTLSQSFIAALIVRYFMEAAHDYHANGHMPFGVAWLGGPLLVALLIHLCFCFAAFFSLVALMGALDRTVTRVVRLVIALIVALDRAFCETTRFVKRDRSQIVHRISLLARHFGERAPPRRFRIALV